MSSPNYGLTYLDAGSLWNIFSPNPVLGIGIPQLQSELQTIANTFNQLVNFIDGKVVASSVTVSLSSTQILGLDINPISLAPAQGTNKIIIPTLIVLQNKFGTRAYNSAGIQPLPSLFYGNLSTPSQIISYTDGGSRPLFTNIQSVVAWNTINTNQSSSGQWAMGAAITGSTDPTKMIDQPLIFGLTNSTYNAGPITSVSIANPGIGYQVNDTGTIDPLQFNFDTGDATYKVTAVDGGNHVTAVQVTAGGTSYAVTTSNPGTQAYPTNTSGGGNGLTLNVTGASIGDSTGSVTVAYSIITLP